MSDAFTRKKNNILSQLAVSEDEYSDRSVKGTIDEPISDLISEINAYNGLVTTSSCSGRISVFLEGESEGGHEDNQSDIAVSGGNDQEDTFRSTGKKAEKKRKGGKWLYINHAALDPESARSASTSASLHDLFGLKVSGNGSNHKPYPSPTRTRFVHFKFEPMILHILTASTKHAHRVLVAAQASGFRESGATSLPKSKEPVQQSVMVAVRTSGLLLDSVIGYLQERRESDSSGEHELETISIVDEAYLQTLVDLANVRFEENEKRRDRFREALRKCSESDIKDVMNDVKMRARSKEARRRVKIAKGREIQEEKRKERRSESHYKDEANDTIEFGWVLK